MIIAPTPANENDRLFELAGYSILESEQERDFDEVVELASTICETPISLVTLVDEKRQWFKAKHGLDMNETGRDVSFCSHAILADDLFIVQDATKDVRFVDNPLVTGFPDFRFYAGMPLVSPKGFKMGTLCVIDNQPRQLSEVQLHSLQVLGRQVVKQMELRKTNLELKRLNEVDKKLLSILAHDLRSPFSSICGVLDLVEQYGLTADQFKVMVPLMRQAVTSGLDLISNVVEWAVTQFQGKEELPELFSLHTITEQSISTNLPLFESKQNVVVNNVDSSHMAFADKKKVEFVTRNLLLNANKFTRDGAITVSSNIENDRVIVAITDTGKGIQPNLVKDLFTWQKRTSTEGTDGEKGSGLGLPMCKEFIEGQGGRIWVESEPDVKTTFYFTLPIAGEE
jgi:signal transduction histidine kinase